MAVSRARGDGGDLRPVMCCSPPLFSPRCSTGALLLHLPGRLQPLPGENRGRLEGVEMTAGGRPEVGTTVAGRREQRVGLPRGERLVAIGSNAPCRHRRSGWWPAGAAQPAAHHAISRMNGWTVELGPFCISSMRGAGLSGLPCLFIITKDAAQQGYRTSDGLMDSQAEAMPCKWHLQFLHELSL